MAKNRLIGGYPVIGIRPTIDARRGVLGVRESLEEQTMNMARAAAKLFESEDYRRKTAFVIFCSVMDFLYPENEK